MGATTERGAVLRRAAGRGALAGLAGVAVMTAGEKVEQRLTGRPSSRVPAQTLARLTGVSDRKAEESTALNWAMHYGQAIALGPLRSLMAHVGLRGPLSSSKFAVVRLTNDQILENATGVGAPPQTWPRAELVVDVLHKAVYAFATGLVADALAAREGPGPGQRHAAKRPGRQSDVGPLRRSEALTVD